LASSGGKDNIGRVSAGDSTRRPDERWIHTARIYREGDAVSLPSLHAGTHGRRINRGIIRRHSVDACCVAVGDVSHAAAMNDS
jgi:hypothetical protein